jgi:predicted dehydrogenase
VSGSASAAQVASNVNAAIAATDLSAALHDAYVDAVLISTRHDKHAAQAIDAANAGKHIFIEKPMALTTEDCLAVIDAAAQAEVLLTIGFNRRMAPTALALKDAIQQIGGQKTLLFRVNAGAIPASHWLNDPAEGGGRLLGEGVHFIDFICGMLDADPISVSAQGSKDGQDFAITMRFPDDSLGMIIYTAQGDPAFAKERVEVFAGKGVAVLDDFRSLTFTGMRGSAVKGKQDKGHRALLDNFGAAIKSEANLAITGHDGLRATRIALAAMDSIRTGAAIMLPPLG